MDNLKEIGSLIKDARLSNNLTMEQLAKKANVTRSTLWSIEKGTANCSIVTLFLLFDVLNIKISFDISRVAYSKRLRATRDILLKDKKINRFIVMCIEQYALANNLTSKESYDLLAKNDVVNDLAFDYEDLHGMSTVYINDHINALIGR